MNPHVQAFFDNATWTVSYVVFDQAGGHAAIVDSVLDYDPKSGRTRTTSADKLVAFVREHRLTVQWILETHAHADHLSAAPYLQRTLGGQIAIGDRITGVQKVFKGIFNLEASFRADGRQFNHLFADGERFAIGALQAEVRAVPGHTPACVAYKVGDAVFVGDTLFMPDVGTARCDFPGGNAHTLYQSVRKLRSAVGAAFDVAPVFGQRRKGDDEVHVKREGAVHVRHQRVRVARAPRVEGEEQQPRARARAILVRGTERGRGREREA